MANPLEIRAGDLRHKVTIQAENKSVRDAAGNPILSWTDVLTTFAKIEDLTSTTYRDAFTSESWAANNALLLTMRWPGSSITIEPGQQVVFGSDTYLIHAVLNVLKRNRVLKIACEQYDAGSN